MSRRAATHSTTDEVVAINDELSNLYITQLATADPETPLAPKAISTSKRFIFRTKPRTVRQMSIHIPGVPMIPVGKYSDKEDYRNHYTKRFEKKYTEEQRASYERIREKVGRGFITFTPVAKAHECYYETDDPEIAEFIRDYIRSSNDPYVYESVENMPLRSLYTDATFPNTEAGRRQLYEHDLNYSAAQMAVKE